MKCPFLKGNYLKNCSAINSGVLLGVADLKKYCLNGKCTECPVYNISKTPIGRKLTLKEYCYAQFLGDFDCTPAGGEINAETSA